MLYIKLTNIYYLYSVYSFTILIQALLKQYMPKRRAVLGTIRVFLTGFVGFTLIDWLEVQAMKNRSKSNYHKNKMIESVDKKNKTDLHLAIKNNDKPLIKNLITNDTDINTTDSNGATPLHHAASFSDKEVINLLVEKGANIKATDNNNKTPIDWAIQAERTENVNRLKSLLPK